MNNSEGNLTQIGVQVLGQMELVDLLNSGGQHYSHCISIGNPRKLFRRKKPDETMPDIYKHHFKEILRLSFYDVEEKLHLRPWQFPKKIPQRSDVRKVIRFYDRTKDDATGYTIHCWQGISRSTAIALGILYLITGSETEAKNRLYRIRPNAGPHQKIVKWFDEELGCNLVAVNREIRQERLDMMKNELDQIEDSLLKELPVAEEEYEKLVTRRMLNIVVIDDKDHALKQVIYEFPSIDKNDLTFRHFDTIKAFRDADVHNIYIVFLDFFLSKDRDYGTTLIPELECENLICFSSMKEMSDHMCSKALEMDRSRIRYVYSVQKIKRAIDNQELKKVLFEIFSH